MAFRRRADGGRRSAGPWRPWAWLGMMLAGAVVLAACGGGTTRITPPRTSSTSAQPGSATGSSGTGTTGRSPRVGLPPVASGRVDRVLPTGRNPWPTPSLTDPETIEVTSQDTSLVLDPTRDYILRMPRGQAVVAPEGLRITGGHNVVMIGGKVEVPDPARALLLQHQTGTIHIEGVRFQGSDLTEGIDLSEPNGATVELEDIVMAEVHGSRTTNHADLIQTWAGPRRLLVDGFVGTTDYQGFFLLPNQLYHGPPPELFDLRNVRIVDRSGGYALWRQTSPPFPLRMSNVTVVPNASKPAAAQWLWPKRGSAFWKGVTVARGDDLGRELSVAGDVYSP